MNAIQNTNETGSILQVAREWANKNAAGWVLDLLYDERPAAVRGPLSEVRTCDAYAQTLARQYGWK